jgi:hypothetical protein
MDMPAIRKYPSTTHTEGSRHQMGDSPDDRKLSAMRGRYQVVEEKLDGANSGISFDASGKLWLQSRGHYLTGGPRERHFALLKTWANVHAARFHEAIGHRYVIYGEYCFAKHTLYYDALPAYFMEFDVLDRERDCFLSTDARRELLFGLPIVPVPVLYRGEIKGAADLDRLVRPTLYRTPNWKQALEEDAIKSGSRADMVAQQTDMSELSEGLYLKDEEGGVVVDRTKFVRSDFLQTIQSSDSHWHDRPILPNRLAAGVDIFAYATGIPGAYDDPHAT